jgi:hypothetical protein
MVDSMNRLNKKIRIMFSNELERSRNAMQWGGLVGLFAHPIYYLVWTYLLPQPYDNLYLDLVRHFFVYRSFVKNTGLSVSQAISCFAGIFVWYMHYHLSAHS